MKEISYKTGASIMVHSHRLPYRRLLYLILTTLVVITGFRLFPPSLTIIEHIFSYAAYPLLYTQKAITDRVREYVQNQKDMTQLRELVCDLNKTCELLRSENIQLQALAKYADDIRELHEFRERSSCREDGRSEGRDEGRSEGRIVHIMLRSLSTQEHYFLVDAGHNRGITQDMVAVYKNCLVGKVEQVYPWYSKVRLVTDGSCKVAVYAAKSRVNGIYQGCNACDSALVQYVPHFETVIAQDTLISNGEGMIFPHGFSVGEIESYEQNGLHYTMRVRPYIDMRSLSYCVLLSR